MEKICVKSTHALESGFSIPNKCKGNNHCSVLRLAAEFVHKRTGCLGGGCCF